MPLINFGLSGAEDATPEFDHLYLDMNGIIHRCSHPSDGHSFDEMKYDDIVQAVFQYLDLIFNLIKPKKLLMMAMDGVAPRAKLNQQRSRRFRSSLDSVQEMEKLRSQGKEVSPNRFDPTAITPGTSFMVRLSTDLEYFVAKKIQEDDRWRLIDVIYSGFPPLRTHCAGLSPHGSSFPPPSSFAQGTRIRERESTRSCSSSGGRSCVGPPPGGRTYGIVCTAWTLT